MHYDNNSTHLMAIQPDNLIYCYKCEIFLTYDALNETQQAIYKDIVERFEIIVENKRPSMAIGDAERFSMKFEEPIKPQTENTATITEQQAERPTALPEDSEISEQASRGANRRQSNDIKEKENKTEIESGGNSQETISNDPKSTIKKKKSFALGDSQFVLYTGPLPADSSFCLGGGLIQRDKIMKSSDFTKKLEDLANRKAKGENPSAQDKRIDKDIDTRAKYLMDHSIEAIAILTSGKHPRFEKVIIVPQGKEKKSLSSEYEHFEDDEKNTSFLKEFPQGKIGYSKILLTKLGRKSQSFNRNKKIPNDFIEAYLAKKNKEKKKLLSKNNKELVLYAGPLPIDSSFCLGGGLLQRGKMSKASELTHQLAKLAIENKSSERQNGNKSKDASNEHDIDQKAKYLMDHSIEAIAKISYGNRPSFEKVILFNQDRDKKKISLEYEKFEEDYLTTRFLKSFPQGKIGYSKIILPKSDEYSIYLKKSRQQRNKHTIKLNKEGKIEDFIESYFRKKSPFLQTSKIDKLKRRKSTKNNSLQLVLYAGPLPVDQSFSLGGGLCQKDKNKKALEFTKQIANLANETKSSESNNEHDTDKKAKHLLDHSIEAIGIMTISNNPMFEKVVILKQENEKNKLISEYQKFNNNPLSTSYYKAFPQGKIAYSRKLLPKQNHFLKNNKVKPEDFIESYFANNKKIRVDKKNIHKGKRSPKNNLELVLYAGPLPIKSHKNVQDNKLDTAFQFTKKIGNLPLKKDNNDQDLNQIAKHLLDHSIEAIATLSVGKNPKLEKVILFSQDNKDLSLIYKKYKNRSSYIKNLPLAKIGYSKTDLNNNKIECSQKNKKVEPEDFIEAYFLRKKRLDKAKSIVLYSCPFTVDFFWDLGFGLKRKIDIAYLFIAPLRDNLNLKNEDEFNPCVNPIHYKNETKYLLDRANKSNPLILTDRGLNNDKLIIFASGDKNYYPYRWDLKDDSSNSLLANTKDYPRMLLAKPQYIKDKYFIDCQIKAKKRVKSKPQEKVDPDILKTRKSLKKIRNSKRQNM